MTFDDIKILIAPDEHRELEMKKSTGELKDGMHSACAFLNSKGGWLVFGITPASLRIVGQQVTDTTRREIAQALSGLEPAVDVDVQYVDVPDRPGDQVIAMHFDEWVWGKEPYTYHGVPYYRSESVTKQMPRDMFEERLRAAKPHILGWEKQLTDDYSIADLDEDRIRAAVRLGGVKRMVDACNEDKVPLPRYELRPGSVAIIFPRHKNRSLDARFVKDFIKDFIKETDAQLTERQEEILRLIAEDPTVTSQKISERISQKNAVSARTIIKDTNYLQEIGILHRVGGKKDGVWFVGKKSR